MSVATCRSVVAGLAIALLLPSTIVRASGNAPVPEPRRAAPAARTAESVYNDGLALKGANRWSDAETAFREATTLKDTTDFDEAQRLLTARLHALNEGHLQRTGVHR